MTLLTVIPARLGSTRLTRKPLRLLGEVPLVVRVYQRVISLGIGDDCVVATDADEVLTVCARFNVPAVMTSAEHPSGTDRVAEVANRAEFIHHSTILNVQGDEPFVSEESLLGAITPVRNGSAEIGTVAVRVNASVLAKPDIVKVVQTNDGRALYFSRAPIPFLRDNADAALQSQLVRQHVGVYAYSRDALLRWVALEPHPLELVERLEQLRPLANGMHIAVTEVMHEPERGIDTEEDLSRANARWAAFAATAFANSHTPPIPSTA